MHRSRTIYGWRSRRYPAGLSIYGRFWDGSYVVIRGARPITFCGFEETGITGFTTTADGTVYHLI